MTRNEFYVLVT